MSIINLSSGVVSFLMISSHRAGELQRVSIFISCPVIFLISYLSTIDSSHASAISNASVPRKDRTTILDFML